jgi:hypothetical protein
MTMKRILTATALSLASMTAHAAPAEINCIFNDGRRFTSIASEGNVIFKWGNNDWKKGFSKVENNVIVVSHITDIGYMRVAFNVVTKSGHGVVRALPNENIVWESAAVCWFK